MIINAANNTGLSNSRPPGISVRPYTDQYCVRTVVVVVFWYCLYGARLLHDKIHVVDTNW